LGGGGLQENDEQVGGTVTYEWTLETSLSE